MEENIIQINGGITINVNVSVKNVAYVKKIIFGTLLHVVAKMENIQQVLWKIQRLRVMKLQIHMTKKQKQFQQILIKRCYNEARVAESSSNVKHSSLVENCHKTFNTCLINLGEDVIMYK